MTYWKTGANLSGKLMSYAATASIALALSTASALATTTVKWLHVELDPKAVAVWEEIARDYESQHPDVKIELQFWKMRPSKPSYRLYCSRKTSQIFSIVGAVACLMSNQKPALLKT